MHLTKEGNDCMPPVSGGYLIVEKDGKELHIVSVPSPNLYADRHSDSVSQNDDTFEDEQGNVFTMDVCSSNVGVDWTLGIESVDRDDSLLVRVSVEYQANDF
jgi:hypothetical protein